MDENRQAERPESRMAGCMELPLRHGKAGSEALLVK